MAEGDYRRIASFDLVGSGAGNHGVALVLADHDQRTAGQLPAHRRGDQHAADGAVMGEPLIDVAFGLEPVLLDDLPHLRPLFLQMRLRIALGRQRAVAFGLLQSHALHLGNLGLLEQPGLEQLFLQAIAHGKSNR